MKRLKLVFDSLKDAHILNPTGTQELFNVFTMPMKYHSSVGLAEDSPQQLIHQETNPSAPPGPTRWSDTQFVSRGRVCCVGSPLNSHPSWLVTRLSAALPLPSGGAVTPDLEALYLNHITWALCSFEVARVRHLSGPV